MMATLPLMAAGAAARSLGRTVGGDEPEQAFGAALLRLRRFGIGDDEVELPARFRVIACASAMTPSVSRAV